MYICAFNCRRWLTSATPIPKDPIVRVPSCPSCTQMSAAIKFVHRKMSVSGPFLFDQLEGANKSKRVGLSLYEVDSLNSGPRYGKTNTHEENPVLSLFGSDNSSLRDSRG